MKYQYIKNSVSIKLVTEKCTGCGFCIQVCPRNVLELENKKIIFKDRNDCIECGACQKNCPFKAISVDAGVGCAAALLSPTGSCC